MRSSVFVQVEGLGLVIDTGPDFRTQALRANMARLDGVLFTHTHKDHVAGLDDIRPFCFKQDQEIPIYAANEAICQIKKEFSYIFADEKYPGIPTISVHTVVNAPFGIGKIVVQPIEVWHGKVKIFGYKIRDFAYITDASHIAESELEKISGVKVLVLNALRHAPHHSHFNLSEALAVAQKIGAKRTYFTHISHYLGLHAEVALPENVYLAYDNLTIEV